MIAKIEHCGALISDSSVSGESKRDDIFPAHGNGIQAARNRWLMTYATRGYDFIDDDRSILWQLREGVPDGRVIREGYFSRFGPGWKPFGDARSYYKQHGHPVLFGVPKGALIRGKPAANANLFVAKWRVLGVNPAATGAAKPWTNDRETQGVEWMQLRLNDAEDDIEILQPPMPLRQKGFESGPVFCRPFDQAQGDPEKRRMGRPAGNAQVKTMNQAFVQAVPFNEDCTEWADVNHFDGHGRIATLKYRHNPEKKLYEWVETGPLAGGAPKGLFEASLLRHGRDWIVAARKAYEPSSPGVAWFRSDNPFRSLPEPVCPAQPPSYAPIGAYESADGVIRLFTGDPSLSTPPRGGRNPLRCWEIDPRDFSASNPRVIFDTYDAKLPMREACGPVVDMCKLLPHAGGTVQYVIHRVRPKAIKYPANTKAVANADEKAAAGIYCAKIHYDREYRGCWEFPTR